MALDLNPQSPAQAATQSVEQQSADAPSAAIAPGQPEVPMVGTSTPAPPNANPVSSKNMATNSIAAIQSSKGQPGDWARGILAGALHGVAGVGQTMEGMGADLKGPIGAIGTMAGSRPGQEYNDLQAAAHARHMQGQEDVLFKQKVAQNDIDAKKASFELEHAKNIAKQQDDTYQQGIIDRTAKMLSGAQSSGSLNIVSSFLDAKEAAQAASKPDQPGLTAIPVSRIPQADGTYKTMYDVVQSTGSFTPSPDQQAFLAKYVGKKDVTSESSAQWLQDYALGTKNEVMDKTLQDAQTKLGIDKTKLETTERDPESMGLFGSYYHHVAQQNPNSDIVENMGEAYLHMAADAGQQIKGQFTPKAFAAQKALRSVEAEFGGAAGIGKLINADQVAFDRLIAAREKTASGPEKTFITAANKRLTDDNTVLNQTNSRIGALQNIVNQKGNETLMSGLLKKAGLASVDQAQTELSTLLGQRAAQIFQIATDRQNLDKLSKGQLSAAPGMVTMIAPNGQTKQIPPGQVDHYKSLGAKVQQ